MPRFAANLTMMFQEHAFMDRFAAAADAGFDAVEFLFPYDFDMSQIARSLQEHQLSQALFNLPPGDWNAGERGLAALPDRKAEFRDSVALALSYAGAIGVGRVHVMSGIARRDDAAARNCYRNSIAYLCDQAGQAGLDVLIEPINTRDVPRFFLNRQDHAHEIVAEVGAPNLKVQMDLYHCQIVEGDVASKIRQYLPTGVVGHFQIAGVPERHEPHIGELNYPYLFGVIDEVAQASGWDGWIGCEYRPRLGGQPGGTSAGLGWLPR